MKKLRFLYKVQLEFTAPVTEHAFVLRYVPQSLPFQKITLDDVKISPACKTAIQKDGFGNRLDVGEIRDPHRYFYYEVTGMAEVDLEKREEEKLQTVFRYESPMTKADDRIRQFYREIRPVDIENALIRAIYMMHSLYNSFSYLTGSTTVRTSAEEAFSKGRGVCQDYAQILITLCRLDGIPARYVAGMMLGEGSSHAWIEIHVNGKWIGLDPTHNRLTDETYIKISHGRDCADCVVERGIFKGDALQSQYVYIKVEEI